MKEKVISILNEINEEIIEYTGDNMLEDEIITSLDMIEIVSALEDEFNIQITAKYINKDEFATIDSICNLVEKLQA